MSNKDVIFLTGACGFVGNEITQQLLNDGHKVVGYDLMDRRTANPKTLKELATHRNFTFIQGNILDSGKLEDTLRSTKPDAVIHAAAISSVDQSIKRPDIAFSTNALGTQRVLEAARQVGVERLHYLSTDEIYGHSTNRRFTEESPTDPRNPYAAGKLSGQSIVGAYGTTYGMEVTFTNAVNNFGPRQAPEKLIPRLAVRAIQGRTLPVYGDGKQVREWMHVGDHAAGVIYVLNHGVRGQSYLLGTDETHENMEVVQLIMDTLNIPQSRIEYVEDRKGSDLRYAVDSSKARRLGWRPTRGFETGMQETIRWYNNNADWWKYYLKMYPDLRPPNQQTVRTTRLISKPIYERQAQTTQNSIV